MAVIFETNGDCESFFLKCKCAPSFFSPRLLFPFQHSEKSLFALDFVCNSEFQPNMTMNILERLPLCVSVYFTLAAHSIEEATVHTILYSIHENGTGTADMHDVCTTAHSPTCERNMLINVRHSKNTHTAIYILIATASSHSRRMCV